MDISSIPFHRLLEARLALQINTVPYTDDGSIWHHISGALQNSFYRVVALLIAVLPGILAFFVAVVLFTLLGMAMSWLLRRGLGWFRFDERISTNRTEWAPSSSPTQLVGRITFWTCVLLGLVIGVSAFDVSYAGASDLPIRLVPYVTRAIGAVIVLFFGVIVARFLARSVLIGAVNAQLQYARFLSLGVKWLVLVLTAAMVLEHLQVGGGIVELAFGILFGGIVLTLSLAVGLGSRELVKTSLERGVERVTERPPMHVTPGANDGENLRHF